MTSTTDNDTVPPPRITDLDAQTFDEAVIGSSTPVVVDVWAPWCGPCKTLAPILADLAIELDGKVSFYKVDGDECPSIVRRFEVMSFPTMLIFEDGVLAKRLVGARGRRHLLEELAEWA